MYELPRRKNGWIIGKKPGKVTKKIELRTYDHEVESPISVAGYSSVLNTYELTHSYSQKGLVKR